MAAATSMPVGQCAFLSRMEFQPKSDLAQITPRIPKQVFGHPCVVLKQSSDGAGALIMPLSSYGCSSRGDTTPPWKSKGLAWRYPDPTILRAGARCNSERPDSSRAFIELRNGRTFSLPTWFNVAEIYTVPVTALNIWKCNSDKQLTVESLADLLRHSADVVTPSRWQAVHNALNATVPPSSAGLLTPPSTPPPRCRSATPSSSPTRQVNQPWRSQTPLACGRANNNKRKRRTSSDGEQTAKAPKLTTSSKPSSGCAVVDGWTTVKSKKNKK